MHVFTDFAVATPLAPTSPVAGVQPFAVAVALTEASSRPRNQLNCLHHALAATFEQRASAASERRTVVVGKAVRGDSRRSVSQSTLKLVMPWPLDCLIDALPEAAGHCIPKHSSASLLVDPRWPRTSLAGASSADKRGRSLAGE